jgi:hypothetical protein
MPAAAAVAIVLSALAGLAAPDPAVRAARIDAALRVAQRNADRADSATPGEVLHWIIAFGPDARLPDPRTGGSVSALGLLGDMTFNGAPAFLEVPGGIAAPTSEGHRDQMLAKLGRAGVPLSHPVMAGGRRYTLADLLSAAMRAASTDGEVSWTLLAMCAHLPIDAEWKTASSRTMDIPTLLEAELRSDPRREQGPTAHNPCSRLRL